MSLLPTPPSKIPLSTRRLLGLSVLTLCVAGATVSADPPAPAAMPAAPAAMPQATDPSVKITLFAEAPQIVTPIGATIDSQGRLLVVESHTHFRPKNYVGPATDRIRILEDTTGGGKADRFTTFYEGTNFIMNLAADHDGSIVVSSRNEIFRLVDADGHGVANQKITLAHLQTQAQYPHNGLHGLTLDSNGNVIFGIGENLGEPYSLVGADGEKMSGDTGAGAIYCVDGKGHGLTRIAHGFWNPFGLGVDPAGNLWGVDNDPDGRPPSRLVHVVPGGDFGYEYRYGRTGMHPLQAWDAELPGTLGMVSGVGEAPCAVKWGRGQLFVSSWRDHQVEAYTLMPRGASYSATMLPFIKGGDDFRPVGIAFAPDGTMYITDWGSASYSVNGKGRVWKVTFSTPGPAGQQLKPTLEMEHAEHLRQSDELTELLAGLDDADPVTAQAAQYGLSKLPQVEKLDWASLATPRQRIGLLAALLARGGNAHDFVALALKDTDDRVRQMAVRLIAEQNIKEFRDALDQSLASQSMSPRLLGMTVATINQLDGDPAAKISSGKITGVLLSRLDSPQGTDASKTTALHMLQTSHPPIPLDEMRRFTQSPTVALQLEAVRYLNRDTDPARFAVLADVAGDDKRDPAVRAEAIDGLADDAAARVDLLLSCAENSDAAVRAESLRSLRPIGLSLTPAQRQRLTDGAKAHPEETDLVARVFAQVPANRPQELDIPAWQKVLDQSPGDPDAGRRIFFHSAAAGCYRCHMVEGRGRAIGPDLTMIGHSQTSGHILESILDPSREIAPLFTMWSITKRSGERVDAMLLRRDGQAMEVYIDASGTEIRVPEKEIVDRKIRKESLMPSGLVQSLTDQELRDVVAFLTEKR